MRFFVLLFCFSATGIFAQTFQLGMSSAYSVSAPNSFSGLDEKDMFLDEMSISNLRGNLGAGQHYALELNLKLQKNVRMGVNLAYFRGNKTVFKSYDRDSMYQMISGHSVQWRLMPHVILDIPFEKLSFQTESGLIIPLRSQSEFQLEETNRNSGLSTLVTESYSYHFSFGFYQSIGFEKRLGNHFLLKSHFGLNLFAQTTRKRITETYLVNGTDQKHLLTLYELESTYYPNLNNFSNNAAYNPIYTTSKPKDELMIPHSFSGMYLNVGFIYEFRKK